VAIPVGAAGKLAIIEVEGGEPIEHPLGGEGVGEPLPRIVPGEIEARGV
jgi:hypothetical protein